MQRLEQRLEDQAWGQGNNTKSSEKVHWWAFIHHKDYLPTNPLGFGFLFKVEYRKKAFSYLRLPLDQEEKTWPLGILKWAVVSKKYFQPRPVKLGQDVFQKVKQIRKKEWVFNSHKSQMPNYACNFDYKRVPLLSYLKGIGLRVLPAWLSETFISSNCLDPAGRGESSCFLAFWP